MSSRCVLARLAIPFALGCAANEGDGIDDDTGTTGSEQGSDDSRADDDATTSPDSGALATDGGTTIADTGSTSAPTDGGTTDLDAGTTGTDALFADDFDRPDTMDGLDNGWVVNVQGGAPPSRFHIQSNRALPFLGEAFSLPLFHAIPSAFRPESFDHAQIRVSADLVTDGGSYDGLVVLFARSQVSSNLIVDTYWCGFLAAAKKLYIGKVTDGVLESIEISGPDILPLPADSTSRLSFTLDGDELTCAISGAVEHTLTGTDATFDAGFFGMSGGKPDANTLRFDDFVLETL